MKKIKVEKKISKINEIKKNCKGITLVALVVTIIILIILANVSMITVIGDNGIIAKAQYAKEQIEMETIKQDVQIRYFESYNSDGIFETDVLKEKIENDLKGTVTGQSFPIRATIDGYKVVIKNDGQVEISKIQKVVDEVPGDITDGGIYDGTEEKPFKISSVEDYVSFIKKSRRGEYYTDQYIEITTDLDFLDPNSYKNPETKEFKDYNDDGKEEGLLQEISQGGIKNGQKFYGTLDGKGHTVSNIYLQDLLGYVDEDNFDSDVGIFEKNYGVIQNLNIQGKIEVDIADDVKYCKIGSIAGENEIGSKIINCVSDVDIIYNATNLTIGTSNGDIEIGGISGDNNGIVEKTIYNGNIIGNLVVKPDITQSNIIELQVGGIIGDNNNKILNSINNGKIYNKCIINTTVEIDENNEIHVAGIAANNDDFGIIENCINAGEIDVVTNMETIESTTKSYVAGITGRMEDLETTITRNVANFGSVKSETNGKLLIAGNFAIGYGNVKWGYNNGEISYSGTPEDILLGAIIGDKKSSAQNSSISSCYYNKIEDLYGAEGEDIEEITPVQKLTTRKIIEYMNDNVLENNKIAENNKWYQYKIVNGMIEYK